MAELTLEGERALGAVMLARALHERTLRCVATSAYWERRRLRSSTTSPFIPQAHQAAILQVVAVVEEFTRSRLEERIARLSAAGDALTQRLLRAVGPRGDESWIRMRELYALTGLTLSDCPVLQKFLGHIEARNAIAHGLGRLTPKQAQKRVRTEGLLRQAGVTLVGDSLRTDRRTVEHCVSVADSYIQWLDGHA